jgi:inner membrane protein
MDPVTHVAAGALISQVLPGPSRVWSAAAGVAFALLPDIDYFLVYSDRLAFIRHHRGFTHSLLALVLFALLGAGVGRLIGGVRWFRPLFFLGLAVLASHLLLDLATSYGTQILFPFSRRRFTLDWLFIIDPYLTALLLLGYLTTICFSARSREFGAFFLAAAGVYILVCACYHHQALNLARLVFPQSAAAGAASSPKPPGPFSPLAALPQPFSCRRWQLIAANGREVEQTFVQLPYLAVLGIGRAEAAATNLPVNPGDRVPQAVYRPPQDLQIQVWTGLPAPDLANPEARDLLNRYLEFARFPLLRRVEPREDGQLLEWLDLRFSVPGRAFPFVLQLYLDAGGRVHRWLIGRGQDKKS